MKKDIILFGTGGMTRQFLSEVDRFGAVNVAALTVDREYMKEDQMYGLPVLPYDEVTAKYPPEQYDMLMICNNSPAVTKKLYERIHQGPYKLINYISPQAYTDDTILMGDNNIICAGADLGYEGVMGSCNVVRQKVYLGHEFRVGDFNVFRPGCTIGGLVTIGNMSEIALGATVRDHVTIGDECMIGMGSVVVKNVESYCTVLGVPARVVSRKEQG